MIRLIGDYGITVDEHQYFLCKIYVAGANAKKPRVPGEEYAVPIKCYPSITTLLQAFIKRLQREAVASGEVTTLQEAATAFERIEAQVRALVLPGEGDTP